MLFLQSAAVKNIDRWAYTCYTVPSFIHVENHFESKSTAQRQDEAWALDYPGGETVARTNRKGIRGVNDGALENGHGGIRKTQGHQITKTGATMRIKCYLELDIEDDDTINNLKAISTAERTTLEEALRNVLQNFFQQGGVTPCFEVPENVCPPKVAVE